MRIVITGSHGQLGSRLTQSLEANGHRVAGFDKAFGCDVSDEKQVRAFFRVNCPDVVFHLASVVGATAGEADREALWLTGAVGTRNIIDACIRWGARMVFASTQTVTRLESEYDVCKWVNEWQIEQAKERGLDAAVVRLPRIAPDNLAECAGKMLEVSGT